MTDAKERVKDALRPRRPPPAPPPAETADDLEDALGAAEGPTADDLAGWKADPNTQHALKTMRKRYVALVKSLIATGESSTDPRITLQTGKIREIQAVMMAMGWKG